MNYKIITDREELEKFVEWLPDLKSGQAYYCCLFARKKYARDSDQVQNIKSDKGQLERFIVTKKHRLINEIEKLEVPIGTYKQFVHKKGTPELDYTLDVPQEALALYILPNPRDLGHATFKSISEFANMLWHKNAGYNPVQEALSNVQRSKVKKEDSGRVIVDFDVDDKVDSTVMQSQIESVIPKGSYRLLETRGGYHILVDTNKLSHLKINWYKKIKELVRVDKSGDQMIPVPGTYQGGFTPGFIV